MSLTVAAVHVLDSFVFVLLIGMGVDLGAGNVAVTEQLLDGPHIGDPHQFAGKGVA